MLASIRGRYHEHLCLGTAISPQYILTSAVCIDAVGPNPIIVVSPHSNEDNTWVEGVQVRSTFPAGYLWVPVGCR